jgi:hypothetical protein
MTNRKLILLKQNLLAIPLWQLFMAFVICYFLLLYCVEELVYFDPKYFTGGNDNSISGYRNVFKFIYFLLPLSLFLMFKLFQITIRFSLPAQVKGKESANSYLLKLLVSGWFILLLPWVIKVIWFLLLKQQYDMDQAVGFVFLSLYQMLNPILTTDAYDYLLKLINPFELLFMGYIAWGLVAVTKQSASKNMRYVLMGYGAPVLLYAIVKIVVNVFILKL